MKMMRRPMPPKSGRSSTPPPSARGSIGKALGEAIGGSDMKQPRFAARAMRPGGMKKGGKVMKYAKGGGIEMKGKTKGKIV